MWRWIYDQGNHKKVCQKAASEYVRVPVYSQPPTKRHFPLNNLSLRMYVHTCTPSITYATYMFTRMYVCRAFSR